CRARPVFPCGTSTALRACAAAAPTTAGSARCWGGSRRSRSTRGSSQPTGGSRSRWPPGGRPGRRLGARPMRLHVITERDVGLVSLVEQVVANIPLALAEHQVPVVHFGTGTYYWNPNGHHGRRTVWEYYFEPVIPAHPAASIPEPVRARIAAARPTPPRAG